MKQFIRCASGIKMMAGISVLLLFLNGGFGISPDLEAQTPFYQGKTVRIVVGSAPGGLYDRWARLLARYMPKYIPGNPEFITQNMPGAGSLVATNYVYGVAKPDGLTLGMFQYHMYMEQLIGRKEVQFDLYKFNWIGSQEKSQMMFYVRADSPYKSMGDILKAKEPPKCGGSGTADNTFMLAKILDETIGAKINTVLGYKGGSEVDLAMERGEVICRATRIPVHFSREPFITWDRKGFDRHLLQTGRRRDEKLLEVPTIYELMNEHKTPDVSRRVAQAILAGDEFGRPMVAPPGTLPERVKILREAYVRAMKDPELLAEVKKGNMDVDPSTGEELQALVKEVMDQPSEVVERIKILLR